MIYSSESAQSDDVSIFILRPSEDLSFFAHANWNCAFCSRRNSN